MQPIDEWVDSAGSIPWEHWEIFQAEYLDELGLDKSEVSMYVPQHPSMEGAYSNWFRSLPADVVTRLRSAEDFYNELKEIIEETYVRLESSVEGDLKALVDVKDLSRQVPDVDSKSGQLAYLCSIIIPQLRGDVQIAQLRAGETEIPRDPVMDPPEHTATITVERRNERNMLDVAVFSIDDPIDFFGPRYGDSTLMLEAIAEADIEPEQVIFDEAFESEGGPWVKSEPPEHAITTRSTDQKNRAQFFEISDPQEYYGDAWGDIREMVVEIGNSDQGVEKREFIYDTGPIAWQIAIGI